MRKYNQEFQDVPLNMVGSSTFGRYPKISIEKTYNMIISDGWLVPFAGYKQVIMTGGREGRGIFNSPRSGNMYTVIDGNFYRIDSDIELTFIHSIVTSSGPVFMAENHKQEIAICDLVNIYIYNYSTGTFTTAFTPGGMGLDFVPGYVSYRDGRFLASALVPGTGGDSPYPNQPQWRLCDQINSASWPDNQFCVGGFQTKGDNTQAVIPFPGRGNAILILGNIVSELWTDQGLQIFPYLKNTSFNIDYGCLSQSTIAESDSYIIWLGQNEKSGPVIMYTNGAEIRQISSDGINFLFSQLTAPEDSFGFIIKQDGHLIYVITFHTDNLTLAYDFNTEKFFHLCDEYMNFYIAKQVAYFNNAYYFVSFRDGNIYQLSSEITNFDYGSFTTEIPRIRICQNARFPNQSRFCINNLGFTIESGVSDTIQRVDLSVSRDGGNTFGNTVSATLPARGNYKNRVIFWRIGQGDNDFVPQFRFWGLGRFVLTDGTMSVYQ